MQPRVNVDTHHVTAVACFTEERNLPEWVISIDHGRTTSIDGFPFPFEEAIETAESFPDVDMYVLSLAGSVFPERCQRHAPGSQPDRGHGAKSMGTGNDRILAVEG